MKIIDKCIKYIQNSVKAHHCYLCESPNQHSNYDICPQCLSDLPYINQACSRCALPLQSDTPVCGQCISLPPSYDVLQSPFEYRYPIDKFITELKFRQKLYRAQSLGQLFSEYIKSKNIPLPECIIPVPLHPKRLQQRGYNQALEIARVVSAKLNIPINRELCVRVKDTKPQSNLNARSRQQNIENAFEIKQPSHYQHVVIFDDVITTGNTVETLAKLLRQHNIKIIQVWSIARVTSVN